MKPKKHLVVFYSRTGTTKKVAENIANLLKSDLEEIIDLKDRNGPIGFLASGKDATKKCLTEIKELKKDLNTYDTIIIGSPTWAGNITPAIRTFLTKNKKNMKKFAFFSTRGGDSLGNVFSQMQEILGEKPIQILSLKTSEVNGDSQGILNEKLNQFLKIIKK